MRPWVYTTVCLVAFTAIMSVLGWVVRANVGTVDTWLVSMIGEAGVWSLLALLVLAGAVAAYRGTKPKGT